MQIHQLQYFCAAARCRNMSVAAEELWISQSSLSKAISSLEDELGVRLFDRVGRNIRLNEAGRLFYHQASHILYLINDMTRQVTQLRQRDKNEVHILFSAASFIAFQVKAGFESAYPNSRVEVKCCYFPEKKDLQNTDFHVFASPSDCPEMTSIKLIKEEMVLAFCASHPLAEHETIDLADTKPYSFLCLPHQENMHENLTCAFQKIGMTPNIGFCTEDSFAFFGTLLNSSLIAMIPSNTAYVALKEGLVTRKITNPSCQRTVMLGYHKDREMTEMCRNFKDYCVEFFEKLGENV